MLWTYLYGEKYGLINYMLGLFSIPPVNWLNSSNWWVVIGAIAFVQVWKGIGSSMILLLAGMQNISKEMQEAAEIDGANGWNYFIKIVFPLVSPMVFLVLILSTISAFGAFDVFLSMWGANVTTVPDRNLVPNMLIYRDAFMLTKMGAASAQAWMLFFIIMVITLFQRFFEKKWVHYE